MALFLQLSTGRLEGGGNQFGGSDAPVRVSIKLFARDELRMARLGELGLQRAGVAVLKRVGLKGCPEGSDRTSGMRIAGIAVILQVERTNSARTWWCLSSSAREWLNIRDGQFNSDGL